MSSPSADALEAARVRLTPEQVAAGLAEARRIIQNAVGYYFAGEVVPFAPELKSLALSALGSDGEDSKRLDFLSSDCNAHVGPVRSKRSGDFGVLVRVNDGSGFGRSLREAIDAAMKPALSTPGDANG